jgi:hypothetical protein
MSFPFPQPSSTQKQLTLSAKGQPASVMPGDRVEFPDFKAMRLTIEQDPQSAGYGIRVRVWDSSSMTTLLRDITINPGDISAQEMTVPANSVYISITSNSWYPGGQQINAIIKAKGTEKTPHALRETSTTHVATAEHGLTCSPRSPMLVC